MKIDPLVQERKDELVIEAGLILDKIRSLNVKGKFPDPLIAPQILAAAVEKGILDAPHLSGVEAAKGTILTVFKDGKNYSADNELSPISEKQRLEGLGYPDRFPETSSDDRL
jgi:hypothetical protein